MSPIRHNGFLLIMPIFYYVLYVCAPFLESYMRQQLAVLLCAVCDDLRVVTIDDHANTICFY